MVHFGGMGSPNIYFTNLQLVKMGYVQQVEDHKHPLLAFSGILNEKEAESMLQAIADRHNKDSDLTL